MKCRLKLHLILGKITSYLHENRFLAKIRCNFNNISYLSETQKNNFQFLMKGIKWAPLQAFGQC